MEENPYTSEEGTAGAALAPKPKATQPQRHRQVGTYDPSKTGYAWWIRCAQGHVAAMGKGPPPVGRFLHDVEYEQPERKYPLPPRYNGPDLCWACGGVLPTDGEQIHTPYLVSSPPPPYDESGSPVRTKSA